MRTRPATTHAADVGTRGFIAKEVLGVSKEGGQGEATEEYAEDEEASSCFINEAEPQMKPQNPSTPTSAEVEQHCVTHVPYRNWCPVCA